QMRLRAAGLRPVSNVVEASNYVMWELGKPVHTFDAACIARSDERHAIVVRRATAGERLETLDHVARDLTTEDLVIADNRGPLAIAGVMGGADSEVSVSTRDVVIESAIFDPVAVRRTAQRHGLRSEASSRFEKGQDVPMARIGADRTAALIREWAGGEVAAGRVDTNPDEPTRLRVPFRPARVNRLVGVDLSADEQRDVLSRIGIDTETAAPAEPVVVALAPELLVVDAAAGEAVTALVPSWRRDLVVEADIAEEVARVSGYETTPSVTPDTPMPDWRPSPLEVRDLVRETLAGAGLSEVVTPALVSPGQLDLLRLRRGVPSVGTEPQPGGTPIVVTNPLSRDHSVLRQNVLPSLVDVVATNLRHGADDVAVFEIGKGYAKDGSTPREWWRLGIALTGSAEPAHWSTTPRAYDLDDAKGLLELVLRRLGGPEPTYVPEREEPAFHPGRTARVDGGDVLHGIVGELHPGAIEWWDMRAAGRVVAAEIALAGLAAGTMVPERAPVVGRFPAVERDVAVVVPDETAAGDVLGLVRSAAGPLLRRVRLFDVYRGSPLAETEKSLAWRLTFEAPDRTLTEDEVDAAVEAVVSAIAGIGGRVRS
ncbi:MAG: phenylalanine--tRNA ligase subunit beta, partial [Chloroflexota bacterium]